MLKAERMNAVYSIEISHELYEEIRIRETWDGEGKAAHSDQCEEGFIRSELYGQNNEDPFDKWVFNDDMSFCNGRGTLESFFENHFSKEKIRRRGLLFLYPPEDFKGSQEAYWKKDPRISWLYYKRSFDAVFPVLSEHGKTHLKMELEGRLEDGRQISFLYSTGDVGEITLEGKHLINVCFYDERYSGSDHLKSLEIGCPERSKKGKTAAMLYGVHSFSKLMEGIDMAAQRALFYEGNAGTGKRSVYRVSTLFGRDLLAKKTDLTEEELIGRGAEKLAVPEIEGRKTGLFYRNYDTSVKAPGGYCEQAFSPDTYRLGISSSEKKDGSDEQEYEYYMVFDELTDLYGWYPLNRFIWENDPEPADESGLRKIILDVLPG